MMSRNQNHKFFFYLCSPIGNDTGSMGGFIVERVSNNRNLFGHYWKKETTVYKRVFLKWFINELVMSREQNKKEFERNGGRNR